MQKKLSAILATLVTGGLVTFGLISEGFQCLVSDYKLEVEDERYCISEELAESEVLRLKQAVDSGVYPDDLALSVELAKTQNLRSQDFESSMFSLIQNGDNQPFLNPLHITISSENPSYYSLVEQALIGNPLDLNNLELYNYILNNEVHQNGEDPLVLIYQ